MATLGASGVVGRISDDRTTRRRIFGAGTDAGSAVWIGGVGSVGVEVREYSVRVVDGR